MTNLRLKSETDYNGTESYIKEKIDGKDISWFPIGRAMILSINDSKNVEEENF